MEIPKTLLDRLKKNEEIARKFNEIEISILSILEFHDFFDRLLREISDKFSIPYLWIAMIDDTSLALQLKNSMESQRMTASTAFVSRKDFLAIVGNQSAPLLANKTMGAYEKLFPDVSNDTIGSIAIAPICLDGEIVGSINQADKDPYRFEPGIDTSLLEQLALKVSLCLSNVTAHEKLKFLAFHDPLTGLLNRGVMERILEREFSRAQRYRSDLSLIFMDLDDFKGINDTAGHDTGDQALCLASDTLTALKRDSDIVARFAGDEFVVILPSTNRSQAESYIQRVKRHLNETPVPHGNCPFFIKLSHGISNIEDAGVTTPQDLIKVADKRLYQAKERKKSQKTSRAPEMSS
jgi:diguanylate cyclase (GGDEF)-like protein